MICFKAAFELREITCHNFYVNGRPSPSWKRTQVFLVIGFWIWRIIRGNASPPRILWLRRANKILQRFTPWQIIVSTLTALYALRNLDKILGLGAPEPLARLYSPSYYRATWVNTGLDAGFATAMSIRPKWLRDMCSMLFSAYYIIYANEADEKLRRFRAVPTVEMLRTTWEKTTNPYIRILTHRSQGVIKRKILLRRPKSSQYDRPITAFLFFHPHERYLSKATDLILDFPGGGFVAMSPEHHEERLRMWAARTGKPVLSIDYGKAPEYPYPFAIDEAFDVYKALVESAGTLIGMSGRKLNIIISGDSAGATLATNIVFKLLELNHASQSSSQTSHLPLPLALILSYAALDFNFTSWMTASNLRVLRSEQSSGNLPGLNELAAQKDHLQHVSPLSMVRDSQAKPRSKRIKRRRSWKDAIRSLTSGTEREPSENLDMRRSASTVKTLTNRGSFLATQESHTNWDDNGSLADAESDEDISQQKEEDRPIRARVRYAYSQGAIRPSGSPCTSVTHQGQQEMMMSTKEINPQGCLATDGKDLPQGDLKTKEPIGTRLTMTSRTGYFQDRIVSPSMMRAMAILYIGPHRNPDFSTDYHISPILAPSHLLAQFPPLLMQCGEKDPFVDDTVIFAGRVREAKRARKIELEMAISGKSARFGESLRMSHMESSPGVTTAALAGLMKERDKLARECEDDWVQMVLFSDWSHGYLQMPTLMSEAKAVIEELAEWINDAFVKYAGQRNNNTSQPTRLAGGPDVKDKEPLLTRPSAQSQPAGSCSPSPLTSETETEDSGITFVPRKHQNGSPTRCFDDDTGTIVPAVKPALTMGAVLGSREDSSGAITYLDGCTASPFTYNVMDEGDDYTEDAHRTQTIPGTPKLAGPRQQAETISETELMRRRRLLDSHIFE